MKYALFSPTKLENATLVCSFTRSARLWVFQDRGVVDVTIRVGTYYSEVPSGKHPAEKKRDVQGSRRTPTDRSPEPLSEKFGDSPIHSDMKLGKQTHVDAESQCEGTIQLVPKK